MAGFTVLSGKPGLPCARRARQPTAIRARNPARLVIRCVFERFTLLATR